MPNEKANDELSHFSPDRVLAEIEMAGKDLRMTIGLVSRCAPDTIGHRHAWELAELGYSAGARGRA